MARFLVLLGPPGAGKGTQAKVVSRELGLVHISSGDIFRDNLRNQTELGNTAKQYIDRGELVPDDVTNAMIKERLLQSDCSVGALLDGYPRTTDQAKALENILQELGAEVEKVLYIQVPEDVLVERLSGRWTCKAHGHVFHEKYNPPKVKGICDFDGSELYQRDDDKAETVKKRIDVYLEQTAPLINYYRQEGKLVEINGNQSIDKVTEEILEKLSGNA